MGIVRTSMAGPCASFLDISLHCISLHIGSGFPFIAGTHPISFTESRGDWWLCEKKKEGVNARLLIPDMPYPDFSEYLKSSFYTMRCGPTFLTPFDLLE